MYLVASRPYYRHPARQVSASLYSSGYCSGKDASPDSHENNTLVSLSHVVLSTSIGLRLIDWLTSPPSYSIGYMGNGFYRSKDPATQPGNEVGLFYNAAKPSRAYICDQFDSLQKPWFSYWKQAWWGLNHHTRKECLRYDTVFMCEWWTPKTTTL